MENPSKTSKNRAFFKDRKGTSNGGGGQYKNESKTETKPNQKDTEINPLCL
jgi:hypothetical protein